MYSLIAIFLLFAGAILTSFFLNKQYDISISEDIITIKKAPHRLIQSLIILFLMFHAIFALCFKDYKINWSFLFLIPVAGVIGFMAKMAIQDFKKKMNTTINFSEGVIIQAGEKRSLNDIAELEYVAYTRGKSSGHHYTLSAKMKNEDFIQLLNIKQKKQLLKINDMIRKKLNINTIKISPKGLFENKSEIME